MGSTELRHALTAALRAWLFASGSVYLAQQPKLSSILLPTEQSPSGKKYGVNSDHPHQLSGACVSCTFDCLCAAVYLDPSMMCCEHFGPRFFVEMQRHGAFPIPQASNNNVQVWEVYIRQLIINFCAVEKGRTAEGENTRKHSHTLMYTYTYVHMHIHPLHLR